MRVYLNVVELAVTVQNYLRIHSLIFVSLQVYGVY